MVTRFSDTCKKEISIRGEGGDRVLRTKISLSSRVPFILLVVLSAGTGSNCLFSIFSIPQRQKMKLLYYCRTEIAHLCNFFSKAKKDLQASSSDEDNFKDLLPDTILCQDSKYKFLGLPTILGTLCLRHIRSLKILLEALKRTQ